MPKEYIEREALFRTIENIPDNELLGNDNTTFVELPTVLDIISEQPIADVQEVRHGKWVFISGDLNYVDCKCSECNYVDKFVNDTDFFSNYCPDCGAKMDKE